MNGYHSLRTLLVTGVLISPALAGCYTQAASNGDYWGYSGQKAHREVVIEKQAPPEVVSDTVVYANAPTSPSATGEKVDTVFVDDSRDRSDPGYAAGTTVVNNYYGPDAYHRWYDYYPGRPAVVFSIGIGNYDPYYTAYPYSFYGSPYYPYDGWHHRRRFWAGGYYAEPYYAYPPAPFYACYDPFYDPFVYPYWGGGYWGGRGYYGDYGYGDGYGYGHRDGDDYGHTSDRNPNHKVGRIGGGDSRDRATAPIAQSGNGARTGSSTTTGGNNHATSTRASNPASTSRATQPARSSNVSTAAPADAPSSSTSARNSRNSTGPVPPVMQAPATSRMNSGSSSNSNSIGANVAQMTNANGHRVVVIHRNGSGASQSYGNYGRGTQSSSGSARNNGGYTRSNGDGSAAKSSSSDGGYSGGRGSSGRSSGGSSSGGNSSGGNSSSGGSRGSSGGGGGSRSSGGGGRAHSR